VFKSNISIKNWSIIHNKTYNVDSITIKRFRLSFSVILLLFLINIHISLVTTSLENCKIVNHIWKYVCTKMEKVNFVLFFCWKLKTFTIYICTSNILGANIIDNTMKTYRLSTRFISTIFICELIQDDKMGLLW